MEKLQSLPSMGKIAEDVRGQSTKVLFRRVQESIGTAKASEDDPAVRAAKEVCVVCGLCMDERDREKREREDGKGREGESERHRHERVERNRGREKRETAKLGRERRDGHEIEREKREKS